jgi:hypothetical protein
VVFRRYNFQRRSLGDELYERLAAAGQQALDSSTGYAHPLPGLLLGQTFKVAQPNGLELVFLELEPFQSVQRRGNRLEYLLTVMSAATSVFLVSWHS